MRKINKNIRSVLLYGLLRSKRSKIRQASILFVRHDANCGYKYRGRVYSQIIDSLADTASKCGITNISIATPYSHLFGASAHNSPLVFNRVFLRISLIFELFKRVIGNDRALAYRRTASVKAWSKILDQVRPKVVIGIQPSRYLCAACKAQGIPVYDYQHGVIAPDHWWYGNLLPNEIPDDELPTGILCWDRASADALASWASKRSVQVRVLGNPWFKRFDKVAPQDDLVRAAIRECTIFDNDKPTILVSLQWGLGEHYYAGTKFNNVMCDALETVIKKTHQQYNWMLRLHPVQLHGVASSETLAYLDRVFASLQGVEWIESSRQPLPVVINHARLHITDMSTVVTEAAWYGVPSAILNPFLKPGERLQTLFKKERDSGIASLVDQTEQDIRKWIVISLETRQESKKVLPDENFTDFLKEFISFDSKINHKNY